MFLSLYLIFTAIFLLYKYLKSPYETWKNRGIVSPSPKFLQGNFKSIFGRKYNVMEDLKAIYDKYRGKEPIVGIYLLRHPQLMVLEPEIVKDILVKHQRKFGENFFANLMSHHDKIFSPNLFFMHSKEWKEKRQELSPGFGVNKIKPQFNNLLKIGDSFCDYIKKSSSKSISFDVKSLAIRYTAEISSSIVFGIKANSFEETDPPIMVVSTDLIPFADKILRYFQLIYSFPVLLRFWKFRLSGMTVQNFFENLTVDVLKMRANAEPRNDYVDHVMQLMRKKGLSEKDMAGDFINQFLDAFETTSVFLTYVLYEIARNKEVQDRLRAEVSEAELDIDSIESLQYLDQVVFESLRLHPVLVNLVKVCTETYVSESHSVKILPGDVVNIPIHCLQRDPLTYEEPEKFNPDRFDGGGVKKYRQMCALLPFGEGPRQCLGMRYSLIEVKIAVIAILKNFEMSLTKPDTKMELIPDCLMYLSMPCPFSIDFRPF
ncbi:probable cytochrome P450 28d1 [Culicoides brevitarsis]|uniref:probable cytochrome P450 28d1 n=1 Tax=Culicoides brevitarsis TaxID=469753 RepID=UPI00307B73F1